MWAKVCYGKQYSKLTYLKKKKTTTFYLNDWPTPTTTLREFISVAPMLGRRRLSATPPHNYQASHGMTTTRLWLPIAQKEEHIYRRLMTKHRNFIGASKNCRYNCSNWLLRGKKVRSTTEMLKKKNPFLVRWNFSFPSPFLSFFQDPQLILFV